MVLLGRVGMLNSPELRAVMGGDGGRLPVDDAAKALRRAKEASIFSVVMGAHGVRGEEGMTTQNTHNKGLQPCQVLCSLSR